MQNALKAHLAKLCPSLEKNPKLLEDYHRRFQKSEGNPLPIKDLSNPDDWKKASAIAGLSDNDFVLVHRTNRLPKGVINPSMQSDRLRATVHFSLNGPVTSHHWGNWKDCKYTVLIPLSALDEETKKRIVTFNPVDTYFLGSVKLPKGTVILGKKADLVKNAFLGNAKFEAVPAGQDSEEHVYKKVLELGKCPMATSWRTWASWDETHHKALVNEMAENLGLPRYAMHEDSLYHVFESISKNQELKGDYPFSFKPSQLLDAYREDLVSVLEHAKAHPDEHYKQYQLPRAQKTLELFDQDRPRIERIWNEGLARKRAENSLKGFASKLEKSHYNKMHGKGESW